MIVPAPTRRVFGAAGNYRYRRHRALGAYNPPPAPTMQDCGIPPDPACVLANNAAEVAYQQAIGDAQASNDRDICIANANQSDEPWRSQMIDQCNQRWPQGYSGEVPIENLTPPQAANAMLTPTQEATQYDVAQAAQAAQLRAELAKANQTFIPPSALPNVFVSKDPAAPPPVVNPPKPPVTPTPSGPNAPAPASAGGSMGFDLSSIPTWAWLAAAAGVAYFAFGGHR